MKSASNSERSVSVDHLRAVAILLVMLVHFPRLRQFIPGLNPWSGVDLFFTISGYIVAKSFVPALDRAIASEIGSRTKLISSHLRAFFVRRFFRIMPPLTAVLCFYLIVAGLINEPVGSPWVRVRDEVLAIYTYTANIHAGLRGNTPLGWHWSLAAEEQFYFLFPILMVVFPTLGSRFFVTAATICLLTFIIRPNIGSLFPDYPGSMYMPHYRCDGLGYGLLVFYFTQHSYFFKFKKILSRMFPWFIAMVQLALIMLLTWSVNLTFQFAIPVIGIASAFLVLIAVVYPRPLLDKFPRINRFLAWLGLRSYGLYLAHIPVVRCVTQIEQVIFGTTLPYALHFFIIVSTLGLTVELLYHLVEAPCIAIGRRYSEKILS